MVCENRSQRQCARGTSSRHAAGRGAKPQSPRCVKAQSIVGVCLSRSLAVCPSVCVSACLVCIRVRGASLSARVCARRGAASLRRPPDALRDSAMTSSRMARTRAGGGSSPVLARRHRHLTRHARPSALHQVVFLQVQLQDGVLDGGEHEADVLRVCGNIPTHVLISSKTRTT